MKRMMGLVSTNYSGNDFGMLTEERPVASIPFGGRYRLVDFPLSNMVNSGINKVGVITEQNYQSLMDHLGSGKSWDLSRKREGLYLLPPFGAETMRTEGKISSLASIMRFLRNSKEEYVLLSDCDTVANIDYKEVFALHTAKEADITIVYRHGVSPDTDKNAVYTVDPEGFIRDMVVKRGSDTDCNFGMGMCLIGRKRLMAMVEECMGRNLYDFDRDLLQRNLPDMRVCGYEFTGAAYSISSLGSYFDANMALLNAEVRQQLFLSSRPIYTKVRDCPPALYGLHASVSHSLVADGARVDGTVRNSIIFRDVNIGRDARVENCIVMQGTAVGAGANLCYVILDKNVSIQDGRTLQGFGSYPIYIGKGSAV